MPQGNKTCDKAEEWTRAANETFKACAAGAATGGVVAGPPGALVGALAGGLTRSLYGVFSGEGPRGEKDYYERPPGLKK